MSEVDEIRERYSRRKLLDPKRYQFINNHVYLTEQERERTLIKWIKKCNILPVEEKTLLEVGCGNGFNLLGFCRLGFLPENISGNELLEDRYLNSKKNLPSSVKLYYGNFLDLDFSDKKYDIVYQSVVFSSILDLNFRKEMADKMWSVTKPGGGILWYDFIFNNPSNPDVKGVRLREIKKLFPGQEIKKWRITLAPPVARKICKLSPFMYPLLNSAYFLRTHLLCWIEKI